MGAEPEATPAYSMDWSEPQGEERLWAAARRHLIGKPKDDEAAGDVILFRMRDRAVAKHLGVQAVVGEAASFVHAYTGHGVVESPLSTPWRRRIAARFQFPKGV
ncbi:putative phage cell wall peptidase, NlpC/P60 family [Sulfitobacter noctilucicola]|nr:putative phage cell wall peptidase, NlpC/P60 family [Sulfitobacter noctilucicola]